MHRRLLRLLALTVLAGLLAAACGNDRSSEDTAEEPDAGTTETTAADDSTTETTAAVEEGPTFGDLAWPCSDGDASGATQQGVTDDTITIGTGDDRGFAGQPGLNQEATDAVIAFIEKCNELGGINGRQLEYKNYDAALFNIGAAMTAACTEVFMLVGQSWAVDDQGEQLRNGCKLATVPGFSVSAAFAHGPNMYQSVPNPADQSNVSQAYQLAELLPDAIDNVATLYGNFPATIETKDKIIRSYPEAGFTFTTNLEYNVGGEEDWTPFVLQMKEAGVELAYYAGACNNLQRVKQAGIRQGFDVPYLVEANLYAKPCIDLNADGSLDDTYVKMAYIPFEEADQNQATADFIEIVEGAGAAPSLLGMQASASFLLWATGAAACGSELTSDCVLDNIAEIDEWTAGGLHAPTVPRDNDVHQCGLLMKIEGRNYVRVAPTEPATFDCDDKYVVEVDTPALQAAKLDANRVSTLYAGG